MKIGIDLHGTITSDPDMFRKMMVAFKRDSHDVIVISGPPREQIIEELDELKIYNNFYDKVVSVVDFLLSCGHEHHIDGNGNYHFAEDVWWQSKALICAAHDIDMMFDDKMKYGHHFVGKCRFFLVKPMHG